MPESAGSLSASHSAIQCFTVLQCDQIALTTGRKVMSKHNTWSSAWLAIHATWSGASRGLMVCITRPLPAMPKYSSKCR